MHEAIMVNASEPVAAQRQLKYFAEVFSVSYDSMDGYAQLDPDDDDELKALFLTPEIMNLLREKYPDNLTEATQEYVKGIRALLKELADSPRNQTDGGTGTGELHLRVPGTDRYFFSIKQSLLSLAVTVIPSVAITLLVPPLVLLKLAPTTISAGKAVWDATAKLSDSDLDAYTAVVRAIERNRSVTLGPRGATKENILASFELDKKLDKPNNLDDKLADLCKRNVLRKDVSGSETQYFKGI